MIHLSHSNISCGVKQLVIGVRDKPTQEQLEGLIRNAYCAIIMASVANKRKDVIELLKKNGFKSVGKPASAKQTQYTFFARHAKTTENRRYYW